jgi:NAD(P)-dependent dehydrogenase (short-subunit alcohol dehydrogenase family)
MTTDRTAIVTGAGKRVGAEIARALLDDGWSVVAHVHHEADDPPPGSVKVVADLIDLNCAEKIFGVTSVLPPVRLLVNNASRFALDGFGEFDPAQFNAHMAINVCAPALLTERLAKQHDGGDGLIVNILDSKLAALNPDYLSYTLSKQALYGFTQLGARSLTGKSIRVNGIAPGLMLRSSGQSEANFETMHGRNPLGRGVEPHDIVHAIRYFVDAKCVTGQVLVIDSGQRFMGLQRDVQFLSSSGEDLLEEE